MGTVVNKKDMAFWLYRKSLYDFIKHFWPAVESVPFCDSWLIEFEAECFMYSVKHFLPYYVWCDWITDDVYNYIKEKSGGVCPVRDKMYKGKHVRNHNWNIGPRHMKSLIMNVFGPVWVGINTPVSVASVSHSRDLSTEQNMKRQKLLESDIYNYYFHINNPNRLASSTASSIAMVSGTRLYSVSMGSFTGFGADIIVADDLVDVTKAKKDGAILRNAIDFFLHSMPTRLNTQETGVIWNIQQRLGKGDITDIILEDPELSQLYSHTVVRAIQEQEIRLIFPCSGKVKVLKKGEYLWPERFGDYTSVKMQLGNDEFDIQYNQDAGKSTFNIIKEDYIHYISESDAQETKQMCESEYFSYDCPVKDKESNDLLGCTSGFGNANELIIDGSFAQHMGYVATKEYLRNINLVNPNTIQILEDKANGSALIQDCSDIPGIVGFDPGARDKSQRLKLASIYMQNGSVRFIKNKATEQLISHLIKFPFLQHDDDVDSFSQLVLYHFNSSKVGVYTNAFTYENLINEDDNKYKKFEYAATIDGEVIKVLAIYRNPKDDVFEIWNEWTFNGQNAFENWYTQNKLNGNYIVDCSNNNVLSLMINNFIIPFIKFNDKDQSKSINILKQGFYNKKIKVYRKCNNTIRDIKKLRITETSYNNGTNKLETQNEGFAKCVRGYVTYIRGLSNVWV